MSYFEKHQSMIDEAVAALHHRGFYTPYPEHHKAYGDDGMETGQSVYQGLLNKPFAALTQENETADWVGDEVSPYSVEPLGISYPSHTADEWVKTCTAGPQNLETYLSRWSCRHTRRSLGPHPGAIFRTGLRHHAYHGAVFYDVIPGLRSAQ